jgi:hypothetical protein
VSAHVVEVVFLKPTFVPQAVVGGIGVQVKAAAPRPAQLPAASLIKLNVLS